MSAPTELDPLEPCTVQWREEQRQWHCHGCGATWAPRDLPRWAVIETAVLSGESAVRLALADAARTGGITAAEYQLGLTWLEDVNRRPN